MHVTMYIYVCVFEYMCVVYVHVCMNVFMYVCLFYTPFDNISLIHMYMYNHQQMQVIWIKALDGAATATLTYFKRVRLETVVGDGNDIPLRKEITLLLIACFRISIQNPNSRELHFCFRVKYVHILDIKMHIQKMIIENKIAQQWLLYKCN